MPLRPCDVSAERLEREPELLGALLRQYLQPRHTQLHLDQWDYLYDSYGAHSCQNFEGLSVDELQMREKYFACVDMRGYHVCQILPVAIGSRLDERLRSKNRLESQNLSTESSDESDAKRERYRLIDSERKQLAGCVIVKGSINYVPNFLNNNVKNAHVFRNANKNMVRSYFYNKFEQGYMMYDEGGEMTLRDPFAVEVKPEEFDEEFVRHVLQRSIGFSEYEDNTDVVNRRVSEYLKFFEQLSLNTVDIDSLSNKTVTSGPMLLSILMSQLDANIEEFKKSGEAKVPGDAPRKILPSASAATRKTLPEASASCDAPPSASASARETMSCDALRKILPSAASSEASENCEFRKPLPEASTSSDAARSLKPSKRLCSPTLTKTISKFKTIISTGQLVFLISKKSSISTTTQKENVKMRHKNGGGGNGYGSNGGGSFTVNFGHNKDSVFSQPNEGRMETCHNQLKRFHNKTLQYSTEYLKIPSDSLRIIAPICPGNISNIGKRMNLTPNAKFSFFALSDVERFVKVLMQVYGEKNSLDRVVQTVPVRTSASAVTDLCCGREQRLQTSNFNCHSERSLCCGREQEHCSAYSTSEESSSSLHNFRRRRRLVVNSVLLDLWVEDALEFFFFVKSVCPGALVLTYRDFVNVKVQNGVLLFPLVLDDADCTCGSLVFSRLLRTEERRDVNNPQTLAESFSKSSMTEHDIQFSNLVHETARAARSFVGDGLGMLKKCDCHILVDWNELKFLGLDAEEAIKLEVFCAGALEECKYYESTAISKQIVTINGSRKKFRKLDSLSEKTTVVTELSQGFYTKPLRLFCLFYDFHNGNVEDGYCVGKHVDLGVKYIIKHSFLFKREPKGSDVFFQKVFHFNELTGRMFVGYMISSSRLSFISKRFEIRLVSDSKMCVYEVYLQVNAVDSYRWFMKKSDTNRFVFSLFIENMGSSLHEFKLYNPYGQKGIAHREEFRDVLVRENGLPVDVTVNSLSMLKRKAAGQILEMKETPERVYHNGVYVGVGGYVDFFLTNDFPHDNIHGSQNNHNMRLDKLSTVAMITNNISTALFVKDNDYEGDRLLQPHAEFLDLLSTCCSINKEFVIESIV